MALGLLNTRKLNLGQPINWANPLNRGLVSRWQVVPEWEGSQKLFDLAAFNHGTLTNGPTWSSLGRPGGYGSITTDGVDDYIDLAGTTRLGTLLGSGLTLGVSFWLKSTHGGAFYVFGCGFGGAEVFNVYWESGYFEWQVRDQFTSTCLATGSRPAQATDGLWHHWLFTCAASVAPKVYCDGEPLSFSESTAAQTWSAFSGNIYISARNLNNSSAQSPGAGSFDNFRIVARPSIGTDYARQLMLAEMSQCDPTLNLYRPTKYFFFGGSGGGDISITPAAASATATAISPTVTLGSQSITPAHASAAATAIAPTVQLGGISVTPAHAAAVVAALAPTVTLGALSIMPAVALTSALAIAPAIVLGSLSITPNVATATAQAIAPAVSLGSVSVTTSPATAVALAIAPSIQGSDITIMPDPASAVATAVSPTVQLGSVIITPATASVAAVAVSPTITLGALVVSPTSAIARALAVAPTVVIADAGIAELHICGRAGIARPYRGLAGTVAKYPGDAGLARPYRGIAGTNPCHN
jgi:hypothetical protein